MAQTNTKLETRNNSQTLRLLRSLFIVGENILITYYFVINEKNNYFY